MTGTLLNATLARLDDVKNAIAHDDAFVPPITQNAIARAMRAIDELIQTDKVQRQKAVDILSKKEEGKDGAIRA